MDNTRYSKYPRNYKKNNRENNDAHHNTQRDLVLNMPSAIGIIAFTFLNGMILGYLVKRR